MGSLGVLAFLGLPVVIGFAAALLVTLRVRRGGNAAAALGLPLVFLLLLLFARRAIWNPDENCSGECWGTIVYGIWWIAATIGAELGLVVGGIAKFVHARHQTR